MAALGPASQSSSSREELRPQWSPLEQTPKKPTPQKPAVPSSLSLLRSGSVREARYQREATSRLNTSKHNQSGERLASGEAFTFCASEVGFGGASVVGARTDDIDPLPTQAQNNV